MRLTAPEIETWEKINTLVQASADCLDRADTEGYLALFEADAILEHTPDRHAAGHDAIRVWFNSEAARFVKAHHHVGPPLIETTETGQLQASSYLFAILESHDGARISLWGRYVDEFSGEQYPLITKRRMVIHLSEGSEETFFALERPIQVVPNPTH